MNRGVINSNISMSCVDGPGMRYVIFLQGCPLRCDYCHNPETWVVKGEPEEIEKTVSRLKRVAPYYNGKLNLTVSGGEPLYQQDYLIDLFKIVGTLGYTRCIDTSCSVKVREELLDNTDILLCDVKFLSESEYLEHTGLSVFHLVEDLLRRSSDKGIPVWVRHVLYPGLTDNTEYILRLKNFCSKYSSIEKIELLPFHNMCESKYEDLGIPFKMKGVVSTSQVDVEKLKKLVEP